MGAGALCEIDSATLRIQLEAAATAALGYPQKVTAEAMPASMARPRIPWEREWPYDAQKLYVDGMRDGSSNVAEMVSYLSRQDGPDQSQQWEHDTTVIAQGRPNTNSWMRSFTVDVWNDAAIHRLCMEARRGYTHVDDRQGAAGLRTQSGHGTAWEAQ